jgi:hypothetical protein
MSTGDGSGFDQVALQNTADGFGHSVQQWVDKARQEVNKHIQNGDVQKGAEKLVNSGALNIVAPQLGALFGGANLIGGQVEKRQINALVSNPKELAAEMQSAFDTLDKNKNSHVETSELYSNGTFTRVFDSNNAVTRVMAASYGTLAGLDGGDPKNGITRRDLEIFAHMQDPQALRDDISHQGHMSGLKWGIGAAVVTSAAAAFLPFTRGFATTAIRAGLGAVIGGLVGGEIANSHTQSSLESFYASKKTESDRLLAGLKKDTELSATNVLHDAKEQLLPGFLKKLFH